MAVIYLTGITIAMLNITGIGFVLFMILFNPSNNQLKRSNLKKSSTISDSIQSGINSFSIPNANGTISHDKTIASSAVPTTQSKRVAERARESGTSSGAADAGIVISSAATGTKLIAAESSGISNMNRSSEFDNIDDILKDLDLSDFDDLNLDDFN